MRIQLQILQSKVARRILWLFVLSAGIPLLIISLISYNYISAKLESDTATQINREARSLGLAMFDHLLASEANLKIIENGLKVISDVSIYAENESLKNNFKTIYIKKTSDEPLILFGDVRNPFLTQFSLKQQQLLDDGKTILIIDKKSEKTEFVLVRTYNNSSQVKSFLIGVIADDYLWNLGIYNPDLFIVIDDLGDVLASSAPMNDMEKAIIKRLDIHTGKDKELQRWTYKEKGYVIHSWHLFLGGSFSAETLNIAFSKPAKYLFSATEQFKNIFPNTLLLSAVLIALLSISLIRKSLGPIEKLMQGTKNISQGIYDKPVKIDSDDEFEELGKSFNNMTIQIQDQFETLKVLSKIDRLILSTHDKVHIINTLIRYLHELVNSNHVSVITISELETGHAELYYNIDPDFTVVKSDSIVIDSQELQELKRCEDYLKLTITDTKTYIKQQKILGDRFFLVYPIKHKDILSGLICISRYELVSVEEYKYKKLRELSDRIAVALANSKWEEKLYEQAHYDLLTSLPNRFLFKDRLEQAIKRAERSNTNVAVMFIDIDKFKTINDTLGHSVGDVVIENVAALLLNCVRKYDTVARFGGDEFLIVIPDIKDIDLVIKESSRVASRILKHLSKPFTIKNREIFTSASIGITVYPNDGDNYETILMNADAAMYQAKASGRNNYKFYSKEDDKNNPNRLNFENDLRHALEKNEFTLVYQPKMNLLNNQVIAVEALIRWNHPEFGLVQPDEFIPLAEETGLIGKIGYWVLEKACQDNIQWQQDHGIDVCTSVNLSVEQFRQSDLNKRVSFIISESGLAPDKIDLEITESITIENTEKIIEALNKFKEFGLSISIDDFGTGFSSLSYLQQFPIDYLKIDRAFIRDLPHNKSSIAITNAIIALAHGLDLCVIAEGVESMEQYRLLNELNCDQVQGYFISEPLSSDKLVKFIKEYNDVSHIKIGDI